MDWCEIESKEEINIKDTLFSGQVFNFVNTDENEYTGMIYDLLISFRQKGKKLEYRLLNCKNELLWSICERIDSNNLYNCVGEHTNDIKELFNNYIDKINIFLVSTNHKSINTSDDIDVYINNLLVKLTKEVVYSFLTLEIDYKKFMPNTFYEQHKGLRLVRNDIAPTIFSFICSQNNNIKRITQLVQILYTKGKFCCSYKGKNFYYFPDLETLANMEQDLRDNKFGYRSKYIDQTAKKLVEESDKNWLNRNNFIDKIVQNIFDNYEEKENLQSTNVLSTFDNSTLDFYREKLLSCSGIGPKVADCILLMGFGFHSVVPIDVHIFRYSFKTFGLEKNKLTKNNYKLIQEEFVAKFDSMAGIVQLYIFKNYLR